MNHQRRTLLKGMALTPLAAGGVWTAEALGKEQGMLDIPDRMIIVFQGDSITEAARNKAAYYPNMVTGMGNGYVYQIASDLLGRHTNKDVRIYNRATGNKSVADMNEHWVDDCLQLRPTVLSLLVGTDDFRLGLENGRPNPEAFAKNLRYLLKRTQSAWENVKFVLGEPFALEAGEDYAALAKYRQVVQTIAEEFEATLLPYQTIFEEALDDAPADYWVTDGTYPTMAGAYLMRNEWLKAFYRMFSS